MLQEDPVHQHTDWFVDSFILEIVAIIRQETVAAENRDKLPSQGNFRGQERQENVRRCTYSTTGAWRCGQRILKQSSVIAALQLQVYHN